jgi:hypothetical protein
MKIIREGNTLEVANTAVLLPGLLIVMGGGYLCQELPKVLRGQEHIRNWNDGFPLLVSLFFVGLGLAMICRYSARFDRLQQQMVWKSAGVFGVKTRTLTFRQIRGAELQVGPNQFVLDHPQRGPKVRLVIVTDEASLPLAGLYMYRSNSDVQARDAINEYLGVRPDEMEPLSQDDLDIRGLVAHGRPIEAIKRVRERRGCSLAEAKRIVDRMKA